MVIRKEHVFSVDFRYSKAAITIIAMALLILFSFGGNIWQLTETFVYCNTMKNDSIAAKLQMQEQELKITDQSVYTAIDHSIDKSINQSTAQSNSHSNKQSGVSSLLSIFPSANDSSQDPRDEQNLLKLKKKKKRRSIRL